MISSRVTMLEEEIALTDEALSYDDTKKTVSIGIITPSIEEYITVLSGSLMLTGIPKKFQLPRRCYQILSAQSIIAELPALETKAIPYISDISLSQRGILRNGLDFLRDAERDYNAIAYIRITNTTPPLVVHNSIGEKLLNKGLKPLVQTCEEYNLSFDFINTILDIVYRNPGIKETSLQHILRVPYAVVKNAINILNSVELIVCASLSGVNIFLFHPTVVRNQQIEEFLRSQISVDTEYDALDVLKYLIETGGAPVTTISKRA